MGVDLTFGFGFSSSASLCINSLVDLASSMLFFCLFLENRKAMVSGKTAGLWSEGWSYVWVLEMQLQGSSCYLAARDMQ